jgi:hypothetical protein
MFSFHFASSDHACEGNCATRRGAGLGSFFFFHSPFSREAYTRSHRRCYPNDVLLVAGQGCNHAALRPPDAIRARSLLSNTYSPHIYHGEYSTCLGSAHQRPFNEFAYTYRLVPPPASSPPPFPCWRCLSRRYQLPCTRTSVTRITWFIITPVALCSPR